MTANQETPSQPNVKTATKEAKEARVAKVAKEAKEAKGATAKANSARKKDAPRKPQRKGTSAPHAAGRGWKTAKLRR